MKDAQTEAGRKHTFCREYAGTYLTLLLRMQPCRSG